jgi:uncharacterized protein YndB with AHSA1/START domain/predicted enzyme related to lactoylglutathione lyase
MLRGLRTVVYDVDDVDQAKAWYAQVTGGAPYFDEPFYVGFDVGGYELGLRPRDAARGPGDGGATTYWAVDDVEATVERLRSLGAELREAPQEVGGGIRTASVTDRFGNPLGLIYNPHFAPKLTHAPADDIAGEAIVKTATVAPSCEEAWQLWATSEGLAAWWIQDTQVDLRPGGSYALHFLGENPPGEKGADWCRVLSFVPGRMLSFTWNAPPHLATRPLMTWVVLDFEPVDEGTRVTLTHLGWPQSGLDDEASDWPATRAYFEDAWGGVMESFASWCLSATGGSSVSL